MNIYGYVPVPVMPPAFTYLVRDCILVEGRRFCEQSELSANTIFFVIIASLVIIGALLWLVLVFMRVVENEGSVRELIARDLAQFQKVWRKRK